MLSNNYSYSDWPHERAIALEADRTPRARIRPELFGEEALVFPSRDGSLLDPHNFRVRAFDRIVRKALGLGRRFSLHGLRHTFTTLHLARGTPIKWIQAQGRSSAKLLLDWYGHFLPSEQHGYADALGTAPRRSLTLTENSRRPRTAAPTRDCVAPRAGFEPATRRLEGEEEPEE